MQQAQTFQEVLSFWFEEISEEDWFRKSDDLDRRIHEKFSCMYQQAIAGELDDWRENPEGRLAEILILDQFSRNLFRDSPAAFSADSMALTLAQEAVRRGADKAISIHRARFFYMPYMHSESAKIHETAVILFSADGLEDNLKYEYMHKKIIDRFSRYPHRNEILGRVSTPEEIEFLQEPGSSF